jgi:hypothetical protein
VAYALFRDLVVTARRRPKLELRFDRAGNDQVIFGTAGGFNAAHVRLRVANGPGKDTADERGGDGDRGAAARGFAGRRSTDPPPFDLVRHQPSSNGLRRASWLGEAHRSPARRLAGDDEVEAPIQLDLNPKPTGSQDFLDPGTYEISIEIRARNADALRYVIPISWDGKRSAGAAMWDHLRVEPPRRAP